MVYDIEMLRSFYSNFPKRVDVAREKIGRPMTLAEKILYAHLYDEKTLRLFRRGDDYVNFRPDRARQMTRIFCNGPDGIVAVHECWKKEIRCPGNCSLRSPDPGEYRCESRY